MSHVEFRFDHRDHNSTVEKHVKSIMKKHGGSLADVSDKAAHFNVPADKHITVSKELKSKGVRHDVNEAYDRSRYRSRPSTRGPSRGARKNSGGGNMTLDQAMKMVDKQMGSAEKFAKRWNLKKESVETDATIISEGRKIKFNPKTDHHLGTFKASKQTHVIAKKSKRGYDVHVHDSKSGMAEPVLRGFPLDGIKKRLAADHHQSRFKKAGGVDWHHDSMKEDVQLDELSKDKMTHYLDKSREEEERIAGARGKSKKYGFAKRVDKYLEKKQKNRKKGQERAMKKLVPEGLEEGIKTSNPGRGYHGHAVDTTKSDNDAHAKYAKTHAHVKKLTGADDTTAKHYLDSSHGRHLGGMENDHGYIKKNFKRFKKTYNPKHFEEARSADKKPEKFIGPDGKTKVRMVPVDKNVEKDMKEAKLSYDEFTAGVKTRPAKTPKGRGSQKRYKEWIKSVQHADTVERNRQERKMRGESVEVNEAKKIASIKSTDRNGNTHYIHHYDSGVVSSHSNRSKQELSLANHAFRHRGGTASQKKAVRDVIKKSKNSSDLARNMNNSGLGHQNWQVHEEVEQLGEAIFDHRPDTYKKIKIFHSDSKVHKAARGTFPDHHKHEFDKKKNTTTLHFKKHIDKDTAKKLDRFNSNWQTRSMYHEDVNESAEAQKKIKELLAKRARTAGHGRRAKIDAHIASIKKQHNISEETINEISKGLKNRYIRRAAMSAADTAHDHGMSKAVSRSGMTAQQSDDNWEKQKKARKKVMNRLKGIERATKEGVEEGTQDPKLAAQLAARKAQRAKNAQRKKAATAKKKAAAAKPKVTRAPRKKTSDIRDSADRNIIMQLRKAQDVGGKHDIEFRRGKGRLDAHHIDAILKTHDALTKNDHKRLLRIKVHQNPEQAKQIADKLHKKLGGKNVQRSKSIYDEK